MIEYLLSIALMTPAHALLPTGANAAIPFYRTPQSAFASGQVSRNILEDKQQRTELEVLYYAIWNNKEYFLKGENILRDIQVSKNAQAKSKIQILAEPKSNARPLQFISADTNLTILTSDKYWAHVFNPESKTKGYVPLHLLNAKNEDRGYFVNLIDTYLRQSTKTGSAVITTLPRQSRVEAISFSEGWMKIKFNNFEGYVDINHFVSRYDFAKIAYHPKTKWANISHRENEYLVTTDHKRIPISEVWGVVTNPQKAVICEAGTNTPPLRAYTQITHLSADIWGVSDLDGHGSVWWKKNSLTSTEENKQAETITTEELFKRKIHSVAFAAKNSMKGLVSANGVYKTQDGKKWTMIPQFADKNLPVSIHPNGTWFVGSYRSINEGKTFEPFIRWDKLAEAIQEYTQKSPRIVKLTKIENLNPSHILVSIDTGTQMIKLKSNLSFENWSVLK